MVGLFELGRRNVAERFEQAATVVPCDPLERRELDVLRLEQPDHALRHRVADEGGDNAECES